MAGELGSMPTVSRKEGLRCSLGFGSSSGGIMSSDTFSGSTIVGTSRVFGPSGSGVDFDLSQQSRPDHFARHRAQEQDVEALKFGRSGH